MKPFNLADFKSGKKVVTRDGREVKQLTVFEGIGEYCLAGTIAGITSLVTWTETGKYHPHDNCHNSDLFHPDEEITLVTKAVDFYSGAVQVEYFVGGEKVPSLFHIPVGTYKLVKVD